MINIMFYWISYNFKNNTHWEEISVQMYDLQLWRLPWFDKVIVGSNRLSITDLRKFESLVHPSLKTARLLYTD
jgi:hypothetical protein